MTTESNPTSTRTASRNRKARKTAPAKAAKAKAKATKASRKADPKVAKPSTRRPSAKKGRKASKPRKASNGTGGGRALSDFANTQKLRVLKASEISRKDCFKTGQTVAANLEAQKKKGLKGRRKYLRVQITAGRVSLR